MLRTCRRMKRKMRFMSRTKTCSPSQCTKFMWNHYIDSTSAIYWQAQFSYSSPASNDLRGFFVFFFCEYSILAIHRTDQLVNNLRKLAHRIAANISEHDLNMCAYEFLELMSCRLAQQICFVYYNFCFLLVHTYIYTYIYELALEI